MDRKQRRRAVAILLAFASAASLVVGAFGPRWMIDPDDVVAMSLGLRQVELCELSKCETMTNFDAIDHVEAEILRVRDYNTKVSENKMLPVPREPWHGFPVVGWIAFVASLIAAAGLVIGASIALVRKRIAWLIMPTTIAVLALGVAIINGMLVVATKPELMRFMTIGWTFYVFGGGAVAGLAAVFPLNRQIRPIDPELGAAAATVSWSVSRDEV
jgi:hypothetical protein